MLSYFQDEVEASDGRGSGAACGSRKLRQHLAHDAEQPLLERVSGDGGGRTVPLVRRRLTVLPAGRVPPVLTSSHGIPDVPPEYGSHGIARPLDRLVTDLNLPFKLSTYL